MIQALHFVCHCCMHLGMVQSAIIGCCAEQVHSMALQVSRCMRCAHHASCHQAHPGHVCLPPWCYYHLKPSSVPACASYLTSVSAAADCTCLHHFGQCTLQAACIYTSRYAAELKLQLGLFCSCCHQACACYCKLMQCPCNVAGSADAPVLLSAGKSTVQSSTEGSQSSDLAVDGSTSSQADTCASSLRQGAQYWQVDLGDTYQIVNVTVINRWGLNAARKSYHTSWC